MVWLAGEKQDSPSSINSRPRKRNQAPFPFQKSETDPSLCGRWQQLPLRSSKRPFVIFTHCLKIEHILHQSEILAWHNDYKLFIISNL
jgi:hypothetical protein